MSYLTFHTPTPEQFKQFGSETAKYRHLTVPYLAGAGVDIASGGDRVVPWAISFDLPPREYDHYNSNHKPRGELHLRGDARKLPFESRSLDWVYSSHLLEDFRKDDRVNVVREWQRVVKVGGVVVILVPELKRWWAAIRAGQPPNCSHSAPEPVVGDMAMIGQQLGLEVVRDSLTDVTPEDYSILAVLRIKE